MLTWLIVGTIATFGLLAIEGVPDGTPPYIALLIVLTPLVTMLVRRRDDARKEVKDKKAADDLAQLVKDQARALAQHTEDKNLELKKGQDEIKGELEENSKVTKQTGTIAGVTSEAMNGRWGELVKELTGVRAEVAQLRSEKKAMWKHIKNQDVQLGTMTRQAAVVLKALNLQDIVRLDEEHQQKLHEMRDSLAPESVETEEEPNE